VFLLLVGKDTKKIKNSRLKMKEFSAAIGFLTFLLANLLFFIIFLLKIWQYHKKALPLHRKTKNVL